MRREVKMKKILTLILAIFLVFTFEANLFAVTLTSNVQEKDERNDVTPEYLIEMNPYKKQMLIDRYTREFGDNSGKQEQFFDLVMQKEAAGISLPDIDLYEIAREIKYADISIATPLKVTNRTGTVTNYSRENIGNFGKSLSSWEPEVIYIENLIFKLGYDETTAEEILDMPEEGGFIWSKFDVTNSYLTDEIVKIIVTLINKETLVMQDVAIVKRTIATYSSETITAGFNVPSENSEDYEILIELQDDNMNSYDKSMFPAPKITLTVSDETSYLGIGIKTNSNEYVPEEFTVSYNNIIETYDNRGVYYTSIQINEPILTPIVIRGDLRGVDIYNGNVIALEHTELPNMKELYLSNNHLTTFDTTGLPALTDLYLSGNQLTTFNRMGLSNLRYLYLSNNHLTTFDTTGLSALMDLGLTGNQLTTFSGVGLSSLQYLCLDNNQLTAFNGTGLSNLGMMYLNNNQIATFSGTELANLYYLDISNNQLTMLDGTSLSNLQYLNMSANQLTAFDSTGLSNLDYLIIINNQLTALDATGLPKLTYLLLVNNLNLIDLTISASENTVLNTLILADTALGNPTAVNDVWSIWATDIIPNLSVRSSNSKGALYVSNAALGTALTNALTTPVNKYWDIYY